MGKKDNKKEILFSITKDDFRVDTFRSGGPGGQNQNKVESGVRITHLASGAVGESREERKQSQNKAIALQRLIETTKFKTWLNQKLFELEQGKTIEKMVDEAMDQKNIQVEIKEDGKWVKENG